MSPLRARLTSSISATTGLSATASDDSRARGPFIAFPAIGSVMVKVAALCTSSQAFGLSREIFGQPCQSGVPRGFRHHVQRLSRLFQVLAYDFNGFAQSFMAAQKFHHRRKAVRFPVLDAILQPG